MSNPPTTEKQEAELRVREAMLPAKLRDWRAKLSAKAKQEKRFRFYSLYGLVSHPETLRAAWAQVRANGGKPGVDGVSIEQIEKEGEQAFLEQLDRELAAKTYRTGAVRRAYIRKANGKVRPLGIPNVRERVERLDGSGRTHRRRNDKGTPQGGVISPLLANIYLHWFDHVFHAKDGPARWAKAVLVRYADDFVVMTRYTGKELREFIDNKIEVWLRLKINRKKTRVIHLHEQGAVLDFLGYSFRL